MMGITTYVSVKAPLFDEVGKPYAVFGVSTDVTDRKRAEAALRASEERTRLIVEAALDAVITIDGAGVVIGWNPRAEATFGWTRQEILGRLLADAIIPESYREAHHRGLARYLRTGEGPVLNRRIEITALHRDGREMPVELSITPLQGDRTVTFAAFVRDITDRRRAEEALRESETRYRTLAEALPLLVWTCTPDGECDYLSRQWVAYTGRPAEEQLGYGWAEHIHPDDRARVEAAWTAATAKGDTFDLEFRIRRADGVHRWFKTRARAVARHRRADREVVRIEYRHRGPQARRAAAPGAAGAPEPARSHHPRDRRAPGSAQRVRSGRRAASKTTSPIDFACVCLYDADSDVLTVSARRRPQRVARRAARAERAGAPRQSITTASRTACVVSSSTSPTSASSPFPVRPAPRRTAGCDRSSRRRSSIESKVLGVLLAARREGAELRQRRLRVPAAVERARRRWRPIRRSSTARCRRAYDDLRQSQQSALQQERLRALGQMASGIAHDINNAISPVVALHRGAARRRARPERPGAGVSRDDSARRRRRGADGGAHAASSIATASRS